MRNLLPLALILSLALTGCTIESNRRGADVLSVNLRFSFNDASYVGAVASASYSMPEISRSVVEHGAVLLYFREQGTWTALPYSFGVESPDLAAVDYTVSLGFGYEHRTIEFFAELSTSEVWDEVLDRLPSGYDLKAVIINDRSFNKNGPDPRNYEAVRDYYGLVD